MIGHESRKYTKTYKSSQQDIDEGIPQTIIERKMKKQKEEEDDEKKQTYFSISKYAIQQVQKITYTCTYKLLYKLFGK